MAAEEKKRVVLDKDFITTLPEIQAPKWLQGFVNFVREQGVVGLAIGLAMGAQLKSLVDQLVASFINPLAALLLPGEESLPAKAFSVGGEEFKWGAFVSQLISFIIVAAVIYFVVKGLKLDKLDKKKEEEKK